MKKNWLLILGFSVLAVGSGLTYREINYQRNGDRILANIARLKMIGVIPKDCGVQRETEFEALFSKLYQKGFLRENKTGGGVGFLRALPLVGGSDDVRIAKIVDLNSFFLSDLVEFKKSGKELRFHARNYRKGLLCTHKFDLAGLLSFAAYNAFRKGQSSEGFMYLEIAESCFQIDPYAHSLYASLYFREFGQFAKQYLRLVELFPKDRENLLLSFERFLAKKQPTSVQVAKAEICLGVLRRYVSMDQPAMESPVQLFGPTFIPVQKLEYEIFLDRPLDYLPKGYSFRKSYADVTNKVASYFENREKEELNQKDLVEFPKLKEKWELTDAPQGLVNNTQHRAWIVATRSLSTEQVEFWLAGMSIQVDLYKSLIRAIRFRDRNGTWPTEKSQFMTKVNDIGTPLDIRFSGDAAGFTIYSPFKLSSTRLLYEVHYPPFHQAFQYSESRTWFERLAQQLL